MRFISCHDGKLQIAGNGGVKGLAGASVRDGIGGVGCHWRRSEMLARGAVHELLFDADAGQPKFVAAVMARASHVQEARGSEARRHEVRDKAMKDQRR